MHASQCVLYVCVCICMCLCVTPSPVNIINQKCYLTFYGGFCTMSTSLILFQDVLKLKRFVAIVVGQRS